MTEKKIDLLKEEEVMEELREKFMTLGFDNKITIINWCKDLVGNERAGSCQFSLEEDYLNNIARKQSILQSVEQIAPLLPWFAIVAFISFTVFGALVTPLCKMLDGVSPFMIFTWRSIMAIIFFIPFMIHEIRKYPGLMPRMFSIKNMLACALAQFFCVFYGFSWLIALKYTYSSHAMLFSGLAAVILFLWKIVKRLPVTILEILGIVIAVLGSAILANSGGGADSEFTADSIFIGDMIAFTGSTFAAFNLQLIAPLILIYTEGVLIIVSNVVSVIVAILTMIFVGQSFTLGFDPNNGLFGFFNYDRILEAFVLLGVVGSYGNSLASLIAIKFFSPLMVSLTYLVMPVLAQIFSTAMGLEGIPGVMTMVGGAIVLGGLVLVSISSPVEKPRKATMRALSITTFTSPHKLSLLDKDQYS